MRQIVKYIAIIATIFVITSCNTTHNYKNKIAPELIDIDNQLIDNKSKAIKSINNISIDSLSLENRHYYKLLSNITTRLYIENQPCDTCIRETFNYYRSLYIKDTLNSFIRYNYARAMLYHSMEKYNNNTNDSLTHSYQVTASKLLSKEEYPNYYSAIANSYLASTYYYFKDLTKSECFYKKAFDEFKDLGKTRELILVKIDRALNFLISRRYDKVREALVDISNTAENQDDTVRMGYYIVKASYLATQRENDLAKETLDKCKKIDADKIVDIDLSKLYFALSKYYSYLNDVDKAFYYGDKAIDFVKERANTLDRIHNYYRNIGDIFSKSRDYHKATNAYKNAFYFSINSIINYHEKIQEESLLQFQESIDISDEKRIKAERIAIFLIIIIAFITFIYIAMYISTKNKAQKEILAAKVKELQTSKAITEITSLDILPTFLDKINGIFTSNFNDVDELISYLDTTLNDAKRETHSKMLELINSDAFTSMHPLFKHKSSFSNQENIIIFLLKQKLTVKQIAALINISQSSIRGSKAKIKQKIIALDISKEEKVILLKDL